MARICWNRAKSMSGNVTLEATVVSAVTQKARSNITGRASLTFDMEFQIPVDLLNLYVRIVARNFPDNDFVVKGNHVKFYVTAEEICDSYPLTGNAEFYKFGRIHDMTFTSIHKVEQLVDLVYDQIMRLHELASQFKEEIG